MYSPVCTWQITLLQPYSANIIAFNAIWRQCSTVNKKIKRAYDDSTHAFFSYWNIVLFNHGSTNVLHWSTRYSTIWFARLDFCFFFHYEVKYLIQGWLDSQTTLHYRYIHFYIFFLSFHYLYMEIYVCISASTSEWIRNQMFMQKDPAFLRPTQSITWKNPENFHDSKCRGEKWAINNTF